mgnify:CR=1 FL=1
MITYTEIDSCRLCKSIDFNEIIKIPNLCINDFPETPDGHRGRAPMTLIECADCGCVQLKETVQDAVYKEYWYQSKLNQKIVNNLRDIVVDMTIHAKLNAGDRVLDIGANDGTLLSCYPNDVVKIGVDPADTIQDDLYHHADYAIHDFFKAEDVLLTNMGGKCKAITSIAMFYDLPDPHAFVEDVKKVLHEDGVWCIQLMPLRPMVDTNDIGNICHEHIEYYTYHNLKELLNNHELTVFDVKENDINGGSYQLWVCHKGKRKESAFEEPNMDLQAWAKRLEKNKQDTLNFLNECAENNLNVYIYGASTKGNTIAQWYGIDTSLIKGAAEIHPDKVGRYMVGTGIPIVHEDEARKDADYFLVMPFGFRDVFLQKETVPLVFCTPEFEVIKP